VGYLVADPAVIEALLLVRLPYHLSSLTQSAAEVAVEYADRLTEQVDRLRATRDDFITRADAQGWRCPASDANFLLLGPFTDPSAAWQRLLDAGILVRDVGLRQWLRVTVGTAEQMATLLEHLPDLVDLREQQ
jgi:histidinol-phosphate aminotransferase